MCLQILIKTRRPPGQPPADPTRKCRPFFTNSPRSGRVHLLTAPFLVFRQAALVQTLQTRSRFSEVPLPTRLLLYQVTLLVLMNVFVALFTCPTLCGFRGPPFGRRKREPDGLHWPDNTSEIRFIRNGCVIGILWIGQTEFLKWFRILREMHFHGTNEV